MPRRIIYGISLWVFLLSAACTVAAIWIPSWISYSSPNGTTHISYGLTRRCSSLAGDCAPFPSGHDCRGDERSFCSLWRSAAFFMNFALVLQLACLVAYLTVLAGGRTSRDVGWKVVSPFLGAVAAAQIISMAIVAYLFHHNSRFFEGWTLGRAWVLCTVSWSVLALNSLGVAAAGVFAGPEDDYEPIEDS